MCLGVPGKVLSVEPGDLAMGTVAFGGIRKQVCLAYVPDVKVGDWVIVHVGFALNRLNEEEAQQTLADLAALADLADLDAAGGVPGGGEAGS